MPWPKGKHRSEETKRKISEHPNIPWNKGKRGIFSEEALDRIRQSNIGRKHSEETKKKMSESHKRYCKTEKSHKEKSKNMKLRWKNNQDYRNKVLPILLRNKNNTFGICKKYNGIMMRSNLERMYAKLFDDNSIKWEYEKYRFEMDNGKVHVPDFYLIDIDLFIEVKPKRFIYNKETQYKVNQVREQGYNIIFAHEKNPKKTIMKINNKLFKREVS